jgi:cyclopropane fatty-acyl-phospholipid synthase-like methyltransferase
MKLTDTDKKRIKQFYQRRLKKYGINDAKSVDWDNNKNQQVRFGILSKIAELDRATVLDVGSGLGDFYKYLSKNFRGIEYTGIDIVPNFVEESRARHPKAKFECIELNKIQENYDYIFASGSLTFNVATGKNYYFQVIKRMYELANKGVSFNMLNSDYFGKKHKMYVTYDPLEVLDFCKTFAKDVKVVFNFLEGEINVYLYKK